MKLIVRSILLAAMGLGPALAWSAPASQPAMVFGTAVDGLSAALAPRADHPPRVGVPLVLRFALKNDATGSIDSSGAFAWLLLAADREKAWYSEKIPLAKLKGCPARIGPAAQVETELDMTDRQALIMQSGIVIKDGYPAPRQGEPMSAGTFGKLLPEGTYKAMVTVVIPGRNQPATSKAVVLAVGPPVLSKLPPEKRKELLDGLIAQFNKSAYGGRAAHQRAVMIGADAVEPIMAALARPDVAVESRMWLVTALCDIGDPRAVELLARLFAGDGAVRHVIAYHGQKLRHAKLDEAICLAAAKGNDPALLEWAIRGASAFGGGVPEKLVPAALASKDPRVRAELAQVLVRAPAGKSLDAMLSLVKDPDMRVRAAAARAIGSTGVKEPRLAAALAEALGSSDDAARQAICAALGSVTGQSHPYDPAATDEQKTAVIRWWKDKLK